MCDSTQRGTVAFVGAGPGADDLLTVRGARRIAGADLVLWPSGAVTPELVREHARADAELVDCARLPQEQQLRLYRGAAAQRLAVVRLVPGDAAMWSGLQPQYDACRRLGLLVEIVPGVSTLSAVLAAGGRELTEPSVLVTQLDGVAAAAQAGGTVAVTAPAARAEALVAALRAAGRDEDTPVVVGFRPGRPDELVLTTTLGELEHTVKRHRLWLPALFLVGRALAPRRHTGLASNGQRDPLRRAYRRRSPGNRAPATGRG